MRYFSDVLLARALVPVAASPVQDGFDQAVAIWWPNVEQAEYVSQNARPDLAADTLVHREIMQRRLPEEVCDTGYLFHRCFRRAEATIICCHGCYVGAGVADTC